MTDNSSQSSSAAAATFWTELSSEKESLWAELNAIDAALGSSKPASSSSKERSELRTRQARVQLAILDLEGKVTQALVFLPAYDERLYKQQIQELKAAAKRQKDALAPKARFSFRTKTAPTKKAPVPVPVPAPESDLGPASTGPASLGALIAKPLTELNEPTHTTADPAATLADFADSYHTIGALPSSDATSDQTSTLSSSYKVRNGRNSIINCLPTGGQLRSLFLYELRHCLVLVGPVAGSVFLEACHDCVIVVACRQLRIHTSHHLTFYLHAASHPIIEDCDKIVVMDYPPPLKPAASLSTGMESNRTAASETTRTIWERAALLETANLYDQVNDFKWLRRQASPHWRVGTGSTSTAIPSELWDQMAAPPSSSDQGATLSPSQAQLLQTFLAHSQP
ncbi:hypothetical protein H4R33_006654 [Dimargaris cristalligena]|nr:hypothetical protein H4R33_006654 [Dimargaris cristalligena]